MPSGSDIGLLRRGVVLGSLDRQVMMDKGANHFRYPYAKQGSTKKFKNTRVNEKLVSTGVVGHRLTKRKHRKVLTRFAWEGRNA